MPAIARLQLRAMSPYSQSAPFSTPKNDKESADAYEERCWRDKIHRNEAGQVLIPAMAFKQALDTAASRIGMKIKGKGQRTYSKIFAGGTLIPDPITLPQKFEAVDSIRIFANADGIRGSGKRVWRIFPMINDWKGALTVHIFDDTITREIFAEHFTYAGHFIGIGRFRPEKGGSNGRFEIADLAWN